MKKWLVTIGVLLVSCAVFAFTPAAQAYDILLSTSADRSGPQLANGLTVSGNIFVFVAPESGISKVEFYIDDPNRNNSPFKKESKAPYDLAGTAPSGNAKPFNSLQLSDGTHVLTTLIRTRSNGNQILHATVTVANSTPALEFIPGAITLEATVNGIIVEADTVLSSTTNNVAAFTLTSSSPWLQFSPVSGNTDSTITVSADPTGLAAGTYNGSISATAAGYSADSLAVTFVVDDPVVAEPYALMISQFPNRSAAIPLDGSILSDQVYVFVQPESGITRVQFFVDDPLMTGLPEQTENQSPYDLAGTSGNGDALPYDTTIQSDGVHNISALLRRTDGVDESISADMTIANDSAQLLAQPSSLTINGELDGPVIESDVSILTSNGGTPNVTSVSNVAWLTVVPSMGPAPLNLVVRADPAGLVAGSYSGRVDFTATNYNDTSLDVVLNVQDNNAQLQAQPSSLTMSGELDGPVIESGVNILTSNGGTPNVTSVSNAAWLTVVPSMGSAPLNLVVRADPAGLVAGSYTGRVDFTATNYNDTSLDVVLNVQDNNAQLQAQPSSLTMSGELDGPVIESGVNILTSNGGTPNVTSVSNVAWLTVVPSMGSAPLNLVVRADPAGLVAGSYSGRVDFTAIDYSDTSLDVVFNVQDNNTVGSIVALPATLQFDMNVDSEGCFPVPCGQILVEKPFQLDFSYPGGPDQIKEVEVTASDGTALAFSASSNQAWLNVQSSGMTPSTVTINVDPAALSAGTHTGVVTFIAPGYTLSEVSVSVEISADYNLLQDQNGEWLGFTYIDVPSQGNGYIPSNLNVDFSASRLEITTTSGLAYRGNNRQDNAIGVGIDAPSRASVISTTLSNIPAGTGSYEQAGLWFGVDEDNFNKMVVISFPGGLKIQHLMEINGQVASSIERSVGISAGSTVELRFYILPESVEIVGEYVIDNGAAVEVGTFEAPPEFFSFDAAGIDPLIGTRSFAGIFASHRNGPVPLVYRFNDFSVMDGSGDPGGGPLEFEQASFPVQSPTSLVWAPDNRLYVTELFGAIHALTFDQDLNVIDDELISSMTDALGARLTLGITIDPASTAQNVILWVSHSNPSTNNGLPNTSTVTRLAGNNFSDVQNIITGLPRAIANHAINSLHFGPDGRLYMAIGGNTGAGAPNSSASEFGDMQEQPLSAALVVADVYAPGFDGSCDNAADIFGPPPCDVEVYSSGLRNTYDFVFHTNGSLYAPDNGLGVTGTFPPSPTAPCFGFGDTTLWTSGGDNPGSQPDLLNRLEPGRYYGHPNPHRDECVFKNGSYQGVAAPLNYTPPILDLGSHRSANGIAEYPVTGVAGNQLGGNLLIANYSVGDDITRVTLEPGGLSVASSSSLIGGFNNPLPLTVNPAGWIFVGELGSDVVTVLRPEGTGDWITEAPLPSARLDAGAAALNNKIYVVNGKNGSTYYPSLFIYDTVAQSWTQGPDSPGIAVENPGVASFNNKIWVFGGSTAPFSNAVDQVYSFDPVAGSWSALAAMPTARTGAAVTVYENRIFVMGGLTSDGASTTVVEIYDPNTNSWSSGPDMNTPRDNAFATVLEDEIVIFGGRTRLSDGSTVSGQLSSVEAYDSSANTWNPRAPMPTGRRAFALGTLNNRVQIFGGESAPNATGVFDEGEEYKPLTDSWRTITDMLTGRHGTATATSGTRIYVIGGAPASGSGAVTTHESFGF